MNTHDLRSRTWGHSIVFMRRRDDGNWRACVFLSGRIGEGDHVLAQGRDGDLRYKVVGDVDRPIDPGDQHFVTLAYDPEPAA